MNDCARLAKFIRALDAAISRCESQMASAKRRREVETFESWERQRAALLGDKANAEERYQQLLQETLTT